MKTKSGLSIELAFLLTISGLVQPALAQDAGSGVRVASPHNVNQFRPGGAAAAGTRSTNIRTPEQVRSTRQAHGKARLDHVHNRLFSTGLKTGGTVTTPARATFQARLTNMSSVEHLVLTASHDNTRREHKKDKDESKSGDGNNSDSHEGDREQVAHNDTHNEGSHFQPAHEEKRGQHESREKGRHEKREHRQKREKHGFFHRMRHGQMPDTSDATGNGGQSANQGIGDGSNVGLNGPTTIDELNQEMRTITLHNGTAFVAHDKPVCVKTDHGEVRISPHTAVYVVSLDKSVGVYDIADRKDNDVVFITNGRKTVNIKAGEQILLTDKLNHEFEKVNPAPEIHTSRLKELGTDMQTKIFHAEFSPLGALDHAAGFHDLVNSKDKADRALANHILKTAAVVMHLRSSDQ